MPDEQRTSTAVPCPFCLHGNPARIARCMACGLPIDLVSCSQCEAVNAPTAVECYKCGASLRGVGTASTARWRNRASLRQRFMQRERRDVLGLNRIARPMRRGEIIGNYLGFGLVAVMVGFMLAKTLDHSPRPKDASPQVALHAPRGIEIVAAAVADPLLPVPRVERSAPMITPERATHSARANTRKGAGAARIHLHGLEPVAASSRANAPSVPATPPREASQPTVVLAQIAASAPSVAPARTMPPTFCTSAAMMREQCRPEGLLTGQ